MKVVIALDSFKGTLSSSRACKIVAETLRDKIKDVECVIKPMADGGEGTMDTKNRNRPLTGYAGRSGVRVVRG